MCHSLLLGLPEGRGKGEGGLPDPVIVGLSTARLAEPEAGGGGGQEADSARVSWAIGLPGQTGPLAGGRGGKGTQPLPGNGGLGAHALIMKPFSCTRAPQCQSLSQM